MMEKKYPTTKQLLKIAAVGAFIAGSLLLPGLPKVLGNKRIDWESFLFEEEWKEFDESRLRQKLKKLANQKVIRIYQDGDKLAVKITKKGRTKLLKYNLEDIEIPKPDEWDRKWRIIVYDIPKEKKNASDSLRNTLKHLGLFKLQKSVYLYPYPCSDIMEFLREIYDIDEDVTYLTMGNLENEDLYKGYFGLK